MLRFNTGTATDPKYYEKSQQQIISFHALVSSPLLLPVQKVRSEEALRIILKLNLMIYFCIWSFSGGLYHPSKSLVIHTQLTPFVPLNTLLLRQAYSSLCSFLKIAM